MLLLLSLFLPTAHATNPNPDVERAIRVIQAAPVSVAQVLNPVPTEVAVDTTKTPPVTKIFMVGGKGIGIANCPGHENAVIAFFSDPTNTVQTLSVMTTVNGQYTVLADSDLDGKPELAIAGDGLTARTPGKAEFTAFTMVVLCASVLGTK